MICILKKLLAHSIFPHWPLKWHKSSPVLIPLTALSMSRIVQPHCAGLMFSFVRVTDRVQPATGLELHLNLLDCFTFSLQRIIRVNVVNCPALTLKAIAYIVSFVKLKKCKNIYEWLFFDNEFTIKIHNSNEFDTLCRIYIKSSCPYFTMYESMATHSR
jgi:hypothetical protein